jgi:histidinol-phosphate aminotransferase
MHLLENAQGVYPSVARALRRAGRSRSLYAYPDPQYATLKAALAREAGTSADHVEVAAGSSELIDRLLRLFCAPGDSVVTTRPTWSFFYAFVQRWQLAATQVPMLGSLPDGDLRHDLEGLLAAVTPRTRLVYLVNPCNPTGSMLEPRALESFVQRLPGHVVTVIDEAYLQYADEDRRPALSALVDRTSARLVLLRTFSKFFGLGGLRLGYAVARPGTVRLLSRAEIPFAVSAPAVVAAEAALADTAFRQAVFDANRQGRRQLLDGLAALGLPAQPSQTHFVLFHARVSPQTIRDDLQRQGLVLPRIASGPQNCTLLAVGRPEHNAQILEYLGRR